MYKVTEDVVFEPVWAEFVEVTFKADIADEGGFVSPLELKGRWYFRIDAPAEQVHPLFEKAGILEEGRDTVLITEPITGTEAEALAKKLPVLTCLRVLD